MGQTPPSRSTPWHRPAPVRLQDYDPSWPALYADEAKLLTDALAPDLVAIEHIGSTSSPGMAAKPVIDILVAIARRPRTAPGEPGRAHRTSPSAFARASPDSTPRST